MDVVSTIRQTAALRDIFEALLIDADTPEGVYSDLFGVTLEQVEEYKAKYNGPWNLPKVPMWLAIKKASIQRPQFAENAMKVFQEGWPVLDALFNTGKRIDPTTESMRILRLVIARGTSFAATSKKFPKELVAAARQTIAAAAIEQGMGGGSSVSDWELMVEEIRAEEEDRKVDPLVEDALAQIKPVKEKV